MQPIRLFIGNLAGQERQMRSLSKWVYLVAWMVLGFYSIYQLWGMVFARNVNIFDMIQCPIDADERQMNVCIATYKERMSLSGETFNQTSGSVPLRREASVPILSELLVQFPNRQIFSRFTLQAFQCPYCVGWLDYWLFMLPSHILVPYLKAMAVLGCISHALFDSERSPNVHRNLLVIMIAGISLESLIMLAPREQMNLRMGGWPIDLLMKYVNPWSQSISNNVVTDQLVLIRKGCFAILALLIGWFSYRASRTSARIQGISDENMEDTFRCLILQRKIADILNVVDTQQDTPIDHEELRIKWIQACHLSESLNRRLDSSSETLDFLMDSEYLDEDVVEESGRQMSLDQSSTCVETDGKTKSVVDFPAEGPKVEHVE